MTGLYRDAATLALALLVVVSPAAAQSRSAAADRSDIVRDEPASAATLAGNVVISYEMFTLPNGLRVVVHTDRSVKTVYVQVDYAVGSTAEPLGKTGFAHLFEHLMFNGSENAPDDYSVPMQKLGATINGVTQYDRTAYANMVPTPGLEQALFLESDRMGYLLGALNQRKLDEQRGVVQNEKRMRLDGPLASVRDRLAARLYPTGHPYAHGVLGSMADLDAANLDDVRTWFRAHYGPNNAVLSLTGDIDMATARRLVGKYFGAIPAGPHSARLPAPVPTLSTRIEDRMTDRISVPHLYRAWAVPGLTDPDTAALQVAAGTMASDGRDALRTRLVGPGKPFDNLSIALELYDGGGMFIVDGPIAAGMTPEVAGRALDATIATAIRSAPSPDTIERYLTREMTSRIAALATGNGNVGPVVDGLRMGRGQDWYKAWIEALIAQTPDSVRAAATRWIGRPPYALTVLPGAAPATEPVASRPAPATAAVPAVARGTRGPMPPEGAFVDTVFPKAQQARLGNGIAVVYLPATGAPLTDVTIDFDAGTVASPVAAPRTMAMMLALLDKGTVLDKDTGARDATAIVRRRERMGATIAFDADADRTTASLSVPTANLAPGLTLIADLIRHPAFAAPSIAAQRMEMRAEAAADRVEGGGLLDQTLLTRMDEASPYALRSGPGDGEATDRLTAHDLRAFRNAWLRPDKATIFVVSDLPLDRVRAMLEHSFGNWRPVGPAGVKPRPAAPHPAPPGITLVDRPGSDQAAIAGGQAISALSPDTLLAAEVANDALAGDGIGRLGRDLRETRGWTYNVTGAFVRQALGTGYRVMAPVQQDKAGASLALIRDQIAAFVGTAPLTRAELDAAVENRIRSLSVTYAGARSFMEAIRENRRLGRPDDYEATLAARYRALTVEQARTAFRAAIDPARFHWVVAGDAAQVKPQLETLGLPVTVLAPATSTGR